MKRYGKKNDAWDDGDTLSNCNNARKSSMQRTDGKGALRSSTLKRRLRTVMNRRTRTELKRDLTIQIHEEWVKIYEKKMTKVKKEDNRIGFKFYKE